MDEMSNSTSDTVIGPSLVIRGKLRSHEDLVIQGRVDAEITSSRSLFIENSGIVKANVIVKSVRVNGILVGDIVAQEKVEIASDGRVVGNIWCPRIVIADGAAFKGKIDHQLPEGKTVPVAPPASERPAGRSVEAPAPSFAAAADGGAQDPATTQLSPAPGAEPTAPGSPSETWPRRPARPRR